MDNIMSIRQLAALSNLIMCSDPWPVDDPENREVIVEMVDTAAQFYGFRDWVDVCHSLK